MTISFKGLFGKLEEASVKRAELVEEGRIAPAGEVRIAMDARKEEERKTGLRTKEQIAAIEDYEHTGKYHVKSGGTYTQTHPALMNPTEFYAWKRKEAGLENDVWAPASYEADKAIIEAHFGLPLKEIPRPAITQEEKQESAAESRNLYVARNVSRSATVDVDEYVAHHAEHFGTKEAKSLGAGLHNLYSDDYEVLTPKEGVNVVVNAEKDEIFVLSDTTLSPEEKLGYVREIDRAGDVPNRPIFIESGAGAVGGEGGEPSSVIVSGGGASIASTLGKGGIILIAVVAAIVFILLGSRR